MANKDLFKQAIAEAKSVREAAIANAKEALEETLTPHLKDMLAAKLEQLEESKVEKEEVVNEVEDDVTEAQGNIDADEDNPHDQLEEADKDKKDEAIEEGDGLKAVKAEAEEDEAEDDSDESEDEAEDEIEDAGEDAGDDDAVDGDEDLGDLSVDQFKDMIRDIIAQEMGGGEDELGADDMDGGDIEGMGDEPELEEPADDMEVPGEEGDEEIDLDELLAELEGISEKKKHDDKDTMEEGDKEDKKNEETVDEDTSNEMNAESEGKGKTDSVSYRVNRTVNEEELKEALNTIEQLKQDLLETNLLNSKLLYVNKIFKAHNLNESQKVNVIAAFDKAETVKEVKLVYETVAENVVAKKETTIKEHRGSASKATGTTASKPEVISEVSETVLRMQKLAGIIK